MEGSFFSTVSSFAQTLATFDLKLPILLFSLPWATLFLPTLSTTITCSFIHDPGFRHLGSFTSQTRFPAPSVFPIPAPPSLFPPPPPTVLLLWVKFVLLSLFFRFLEKGEDTRRSRHHFCPRGGGYSHIHAILVCAAVKGMVFKLFSLG